MIEWLYSTFIFPIPNMPVKQSAFKDMRQSKKRAARNKKVKTAIKSATKSSVKAITRGNSEEAWKEVYVALKQLDISARKGVLKKNPAARKKSRLMKKFNQLRVK